MNGPYDDIINLPHHVSTTRPQMSADNRAAQFSPFAALTGYDAAIKETARLTDEQIELDEDSVAILNMKLHMLIDMINDHPEVSITYFRKDEKKEGGLYFTVTGLVKRIDDYKRIIMLMDGKEIAIGDILDIECELFEAIL